VPVESKTNRRKACTVLKGSTFLLNFIKNSILFLITIREHSQHYDFEVAPPAFIVHGVFEVMPIHDDDNELRMLFEHCKSQSIVVGVLDGEKVISAIIILGKDYRRDGKFRCGVVVMSGCLYDSSEIQKGVLEVCASPALRKSVIYLASQFDELYAMCWHREDTEFWCTCIHDLPVDDYHKFEVCVMKDGLVRSVTTAMGVFKKGFDVVDKSVQKVFVTRKSVHNLFVTRKSTCNRFVTHKSAESDIEER